VAINIVFVFVTVKDDKKLPVLEIYIKPNTKLERNRVALRKMVAQKVGTADGAIAVSENIKYICTSFSNR
jgi:hypothetical protein